MIRLLSISEGIDTLPCSIVLTRPAEKDAAACGGGGLEEVIGHARLMPAAGNKGAALVETGEVKECLELKTSSLVEISWNPPPPGLSPDI